MKYYIQKINDPNTIWSDEYGWVPKEPLWVGEGDTLFKTKRSDLPFDGEWKRYTKAVKHSIAEQYKTNCLRKWVKTRTYVWPA